MTYFFLLGVAVAEPVAADDVGWFSALGVDDALAAAPAAPPSLFCLGLTAGDGLLFLCLMPLYVDGNSGAEDDGVVWWW